MTTPTPAGSATVDDVVAALTLEQKAALAGGASLWRTEAVPGVASILMTDGPHGLRLQDGAADHLGLGASVPATCFPPAVALGSSYDAELVERVGVALGEEARSLGVQVLLGPGINIKRSLLCGRNFEYLSEDPLVSGVLGAALVRGVQSQGVGASLKHFAANNQETDRFRVSADVDERPLREIYLRAFERVVRDAAPWTVMCSYNRVNGLHASRNPWLLTDVLRDEWGFDGVVVSDWGAVVDRVDSAVAGLDLEMPGTGGRSDAELVAAVRDGSLDEAVVDRMAARVVALVRRTTAAGATSRPSYDVDAHHALAREAAAASVVLLQNDPVDGTPLLPLPSGVSVTVVGELARTPRYQGAGSSQVAPTRLDDALTSLRVLVDGGVSFAPGYLLDDETPDTDLVADATAAAAAADVVLLFLGLPEGHESEGFDRDDLELPPAQLVLLDAVVAANPRVVVVLSNGGVVRLAEVADRVPAVVEGWLLGQAGGAALADVLVGVVGPSGRLAETIPVRLVDSPAALDLGGEHGRVRYGEGLHVGYRWYDARELDVSFPFGHGLSYTTFAWSDVTAEPDPDGGLTVTLTVANTGGRAGAEVVQVYASRPGSAVARAPRELVGFGKVALAAGESRVVTVPVRRRDLAHWHPVLGRWVVEPGPYDVHVAASSRDVRARLSVAVVGDPVVVALHAESSVAEVLEHPVAAALLTEHLGGERGLLSDPFVRRALGALPIGRLGAFGLGLPVAVLDAIVAAEPDRRTAPAGRATAPPSGP